MQPPPIPRVALVLGASGLLPFFVLAVASWVVPAHLTDRVVLAQTSYGAVILAFLGAVHWGAAIGTTRPAPDSRRLVWSVLPALIGWLGLLTPTPWGLAVLVAGVLLALAVDLRSVATGLLPLWYAELRRPLSITVALLLSVTLAGVL